MLVRETQLSLHPPDFLQIPSILRSPLSDLSYRESRKTRTLPLSSDSLTQFFPSIRFSLITMFSGLDFSAGFEAFWKSFVRKVPIPKEAGTMH